MTDLEDHADAWKARLAILTGVPVMDRDEVKRVPLDQRPAEYLQLDLGDRLPGGRRMNNRSDTARRGYFVSILIVGTYIANVRRLRGQLMPLQFNRLTIDGLTTGPVELAVGDELPGEDDDRWSQRSEWNYTYP